MDSDYPPLQQFFVVMEHCLKHGLKGTGKFFKNQLWSIPPPILNILENVIFFFFEAIILKIVVGWFLEKIPYCFMFSHGWSSENPWYFVKSVFD